MTAQLFRMSSFERVIFCSSEPDGTACSTNRELYNRGEPGPDITCAKWFKDREIIALGADNFGIERMIVEERQHMRWLHTVVLRDLGIYLIENLNLEDLARDAAYEFLFI